MAEGFNNSYYVVEWSSWVPPFFELQLYVLIMVVQVQQNCEFVVKPPKALQLICGTIRVLERSYATDLYTFNSDLMVKGPYTPTVLLLYHSYRV